MRSKWIGSPRRAVGRFRPMVRVGAAALLSLALMGDPVLAQLTGEPNYSTDVPYGSPLGLATTPYGGLMMGSGATVGGTAQPGQSAAPATQPGAIKAVSVGDSLGDDQGDGGLIAGGVTTAGAQGVSAATGMVGTGSPASTRASETRRPAPPSEYEQYVERMVGRRLPRFGADLILPGTRDFQVPPIATVPPGYVLNPGDEIFIGLTGSVDGSVDRLIDNDGLIFLPKIGGIRVAGVQFGDLEQVIERAIGRQYRDFRVSVAVRRLRGIHVYVTGFANNPGAFTVDSLSTMVNAVMAAGGPASGGSFRSIRLYRGGQLVSDFDLYDLLRNGDKSKDAVLQNEDVLFVPPVGPQVALIGSVNAEAIYEARPGESVSTLIGYAGGLGALADPSRVIIYRLSDLDTRVGRQIAAADLAAAPSEKGDIVQILSSGSLVRPQDRHAVVVRIEGEVEKPGNYFVPPNTSLGEVLALAGGLTGKAFVYGTNFQRVSVREQQRVSFDEAIRQLEVSLAAAPLTGDSAIDEGTRANQVAAAQSVLDKLRRTEPDGRMVLDLGPAATALPAALTLENNDRIYVPPQPKVVGVFGAVYRPASFVIDAAARSKRVRDYLDMAGGALRSGDRGEVFVVHANGEVLSKRRGALAAAIQPGDVIFVPVKSQNVSAWTKLTQISTILFQLGLSTAAFVALAR